MDGPLPDLPEWSEAARRSVRMIWACVKDTVNTAQRPYVYNLRVAQDRSYIANGMVVHNCDDLAEADDHGFGPGFYPPEEFPIAPHPNCACGAGAVIMRPVAEWGTPTSGNAEDEDA